MSRAKENHASPGKEEEETRRSVLEKSAMTSTGWRNGRSKMPMWNQQHP